MSDWVLHPVLYLSIRQFFILGFEVLQKCELVYRFNMEKKTPKLQTNNKNTKTPPNQTQKAKPKANK